MAKTQKVKVDVIFNGVIEVEVPANLSNKEAKLVAEKFAICKLLATTENPDSPDEDVVDEIAQELNLDDEAAEEIFDKCKDLGVGGAWTTNDPS